MLIIVEGKWVKICIQIVILDPFDPLDFFFFKFFIVKKISLETCRKKITKRVMGWKENISKVGREILVKTVVQAIPTYLLYGYF